jgi:probable phosphoglycerate mutase
MLPSELPGIPHLIWGRCPEGRHTAEIQGEIPDWNVFRDGCPGGETPEQVSDRADRLIARTLAHGGPVGLFSHGQFGCALAARWIGLPVSVGERFALSAACMSVLGPKPGHPHVPVIEQWNTSTPNISSITRYAAHAGT